ncbi:MAG TPA: hypothetical protein VFD70_05925 [Anaerolineae bacterium]|nr:hypothetical protein [Anaerolineae bacterium]
MRQSTTKKVKPTAELKIAAPLKIRTRVRAGQAALEFNPWHPRPRLFEAAEANAGCSPWDPRCGSNRPAEEQYIGM